MTIKKTAFTGLLLVGGLIFGFIVLLRGCLAKYDERYASPKTLYFEQNGKSVIFSLVTYEKTTSYSQKGGMTRRSVNTRYYVQCNDAVTGEKLKQQREKRQRDIKQYPVEVLGAAGGRAWVFMGELMAYNPFTLERLADLTILEQKNPGLKGRFPVERRFYEFRDLAGQIRFTAADGSKWELNPNTLAATPANFEEGETEAEAAINRLKALEAENRVKQDSLYRQKNAGAGDLYRQQKISAAEYQRISTAFYAERAALTRERDSLQQLRYTLEQSKSGADDLFRAIEQLQRQNGGFSQMKVNADTLNGRWWGLYAPEERKDLEQDYFYYRPLHNETARRQFYTAAYQLKKNNRSAIEKTGLRQGNAFFLDGGFLLNQQTARPIRLPGGMLVVHKNQIGNEGRVQLSLVSEAGTSMFTMSTPLTSWTGWMLAGNRLIVTGTNQKKLSSGEVNLLVIIDLGNGAMKQYDFFTDKQIDAK